MLESKTAGHSNIEGNEYTDQIAKEAAEEAKEKTELPPMAVFNLEGGMGPFTPFPSNGLLVKLVRAIIYNM